MAASPPRPTAQTSCSITADYQREVLARASALAGKGSMIPPDKSYVAWLSTYKEATRQAGMHNLLGTN